jgi:NAD(P)-dependent dehydrogenase (short-subunit alcohol dehydrogenase family)
MGGEERRDDRETLGDGHRRMMPSEIANAVLFLTSDLASGISGQTLVIDSALSSKNPAGGVTEYTKLMKTAGEIAKAGIVR